MKGGVEKQVKEWIWDFMACRSNGKDLTVRIEGFQNFASKMGYQKLFNPWFDRDVYFSRLNISP